MGLRIATNVPALAAQHKLKNIIDEQSKSYQRIASGERIAQPGDDAAGLLISENLRGQIRSLGQAQRNANDAVSFVQVAEGGLSEISNIMVRLRELGIQAGSDTVGDRERGFIHQEAQGLVAEVDRIANVTSYNGTSLLNAQSQKGVLDIQIGIQNQASDHIRFDANALDSRTGSLGIDGLNYESLDSARDSLERIDTAVSRVLQSRSTLGAMQNRLQSTIRNAETAQENLTSARSRIADTDIAEETTNLMRGNILQASGVAVLSQANSAPAQALKLLG